MRTWLAAPASTLAALLLLATPLTAQAPPQLRVTVAEENLRAEPNGARLASVRRGFVLPGGETRGQWRAVTLEAWAPARGVIANRRDGADLIVAGGGTTLHTAAGGPEMGRALAGLLLNEVSREGAWVRVRRQAWIWAPSVEVAPAPAPPAAAAARPPQPTGGAAAPGTRPAPPSATAGEAGTRPGAAVAANPAPGGSRPLLRTPGADTVGAVAPHARLEVLGREGEWARVRLEGWVHVGEGGEVGAPAPLRGVSLRALRDDPERFRGATLQWQMQFMALQRADSLRADFERGEPYLLARDPGGEPGFVYVAVPAALLGSVRQLTPLQRIDVVARVRTGRSHLTGHPVLELVELRR
jgi:hypothetical protein